AEKEKPDFPAPLIQEIQALTEETQMAQRSSEVASRLALLSFLDIMVFFFVLLVGYAYLWKRGDLDWVRSTAAEKMEPVAAESLAAKAEAPASAGSTTRCPIRSLSLPWAPVRAAVDHITSTATTSLKASISSYRSMSTFPAARRAPKRCWKA